MLKKQIPTGVYDLKVKVNHIDFEKLSNIPMFKNIEDDSYPDTQFGQKIRIFNLYEVRIDEAIKLLIEQKIASDIEILPFFSGDEVILNAYTRNNNGVTESYTNHKQSEHVAVELMKVLKKIESVGSNKVKDILVDHINSLHSIDFIASPLNEDLV